MTDKQSDTLRAAAQAVVERWDTPLWKDVPATAEYIGRLRAALAAQAPQQAAPAECHHRPPCAECAALAKSRRRDKAAPQQEVQEPYGWLYDWTHSSATGKPDTSYTRFTKDEEHAQKHDKDRKSVV